MQSPPSIVAPTAAPAIAPPFATVAAVAVAVPTAVAITPNVTPVLPAATASEPPAVNGAAISARFFAVWLYS